MSSISLKTHKMLWGRSGNMCAYPECGELLVSDEQETDDPSLVGEEAHIVARKESGPRGVNSLPINQRDTYENLILMCRNHHKKVDDQEDVYTVEILTNYKRQHENWVKQNLSVDIKKQKDDELYASYIDSFNQYIDIDGWNAWTSFLIGSSGVFLKKEFDSIKNLPDYIESRIWPGRYPKLEMAFGNFKNVLVDLLEVFSIHIKERGDGYQTEKFYKEYNHTGDHELISRKVDLYQYHICLIKDLMVELTRALNYICDFIRKFIFEGFRLKEGVVLITNSDFFSSSNIRVEYKEDQRDDYPYKGLEYFMKEREHRDLYFGHGVNYYYL